MINVKKTDDMIKARENKRSMLYNRIKDIQQSPHCKLTSRGTILRKDEMFQCLTDLIVMQRTAIKNSDIEFADCINANIDEVISHEIYTYLNIKIPSILWLREILLFTTRAYISMEFDINHIPPTVIFGGLLLQNYEILIKLPELNTRQFISFCIVLTHYQNLPDVHSELCRIYDNIPETYVTDGKFIANMDIYHNDINDAVNTVMKKDAMVLSLEHPLRNAIYWMAGSMSFDENIGDLYRRSISSKITHRLKTMYSNISDNYPDEAENAIRDLEDLVDWYKYFMVQYLDYNKTIVFDMAMHTSRFLMYESYHKAPMDKFVSWIVDIFANAYKNMTDTNVIRIMIDEVLHAPNYDISDKADEILRRYHLPMATAALESTDVSSLVDKATATPSKPTNTSNTVTKASTDVKQSVASNVNSDTVNAPTGNVGGQSTKGYKKHSKTTKDASTKIYNAYNKYHNVEQKIDSQLIKVTEAAKKAFTGDKREVALNGKKYTPVSLLKTVLGTSAIFSFSKIGALLFVITKHYVSKRATNEERRIMIRELDTEIEMLSEKIDDARGDGNKKAKYAMMRTKKELEAVKNKLQYNLKANTASVNKAREVLNSSKEG